MNQYIRLKSDRIKLYLLVFIIPVVICFSAYIVQGVYPFGTKCFLKTDLYHQYAPFFAEFRRKLVNGESLLYTWNVGLGINFVALMAYYLAGAGNILIAAVPENLVIEFMTVLVIIKIGLCGVTMTYYLLSHYKTGDRGAMLFGLFYALSGYVCAYYWNLMWLDCIILLPLVIYGIEKLVKGEGGALYGISLALTIFSNYYIAMMTCIFAVIYFFAFNIYEKPESVSDFIMKGLKFAFWSVIAGGCAAVLILPAYFMLKHSASANSTFPSKFTEYFSIIDMLARHLPAVETEQGLEHWPNIYCGTGAILLSVLYIRSDKIALKEKIINIALAIFFLSSFSVNVLNYIWHGMHYPNSLPARQSFIYIFIIIRLCFRAYLERKSFSRKDIGTALLISIIFVLFCQKFANEDHFYFAVFYLAILLLSLYAGLLYIDRFDRKNWLFTAALLIVVAEIAVNTSFTSVTTSSRESYTKNNQDIAELIDNTGDSGFYRIERTDSKTKNDGAWLGFKSVPVFSSSAGSDCTAFFKKMGCEASVNAYSLNGSTPFVNMLMGVKYELYSKELSGDNYRSLLTELGDTRMYENGCTLSLGFILPKALQDDWMMDFDEPALVQNSICDALKEDQVLCVQSEKGNANGSDYAVTIARSGEYYAYIKNPDIKTVDVQWNGVKKTFSNLDRGYFIELGCLEKGDLVKMRSTTKDEKIEAELYRFDTEALQKVYRKLNVSPLDVRTFTSDSVTGVVNVNAERLGYEEDEETEMFFSIPFDAGWKVYVDGEGVETTKIFDAFLGAKVPSGKHAIALYYEPEGLKAGAVISIVSLIVLIASCMISGFKKRKKEELLEDTEEDAGIDESTDEYTAEFDWMSDDGCDSDVVEYTKEQWKQLTSGTDQNAQDKNAERERIRMEMMEDSEEGISYGQDEEWLPFGGDDGLD